MPSIEFSAVDKTLLMPNGCNLIIIDGTIPIAYDMEGPDRACGISSRYVSEFYAEGPTIELVAVDEDGEREVRLSLPALHPSITDLLKRCDDDIAEACAEDDTESAEDAYEHLLERRLARGW